MPPTGRGGVGNFVLSAAAEEKKRLEDEALLHKRRIEDEALAEKRRIKDAQKALPVYKIPMQESFAHRLLTWKIRSEAELAINVKKATSIEETAPKRKHVRSCIVYTWDHKSSVGFWNGMKV